MRHTALKLKLVASKPLLALCLLTPVLLFGVATQYLAGGRASAATAGTINFQARLMTNTGAIAADGDYNVEFKLYDTFSTGGTAQGVCTGNCKWVETRTSGNKIHVANGYISANLGSVTSFPTTINWDQDIWLTMNIGGTGTPSWDGEMSPRLKLTAVPYAFRAGQLASLAGSNTGVLQFAASLGQATTITLPDPGATTATVCYQASTSCGFATGTSGSYIQNALTQQTANFNIIGNNTANPTAQIQGIASGTKPVLQLLGGSTPGSGEDILNLQDSTATNTFFKVDNAGLATLNKGLTVSGGQVSINDTSNFNTKINTGTSTGTVQIGNSSNGGTLTLQSSTTIAIATTNFNVSTTGLVTLAGGLTPDVTTAANGSGSANAITLTPGSSGGASSNGAALNLNGGAATGTTSVTGGAVTIQAGSATGGSGTRNGGSVNIDAGTGASAAGNINIGQSSVGSTINLGSTTQSTGTQTLNVGNNNTSGSTTNVTIGAGLGATAGTTTLQSKTTLQLTSGTTTSINTAASTTASTGAITIKSGDASSGTNLSAGTVTLDTGTHTGAGTGTLNLGNANATSIQLGNTGSTTAITGTLNINDNANFNTKINTGTSTGTISIGNSASGTLALQGGAATSLVVNNGAGNTTTLNFTAPSGTNTITFPAASGTVQLAPATGGYIQQVPATTLINTIAPTAASVVALTIKGTTGTQAHVLEIFNSAGTPTLQDYFDGNGLLNVSQIIQPTANNTIDLGTSSAAFHTGYFGTSVVTQSVVSSGTNAINLDTGGVAAINIGVNGISVNGINIGNTTSNPNVAFNGSGTFGTTTGNVSLNGATQVAANKNFSLAAGTGTIAQTFSSAAAGNAQTFSFANTNTGAGVAIQGVNITPTNTSTATSGTNQLNLINFAAGGALGGTDNTNGINFASATGYTNFIKTPTFVLNSAGAISGVNTYNGLTLTSAADGFTVAGGTTSRTLTVTGADITIGSTIKPTSAGALTVQANGANSLSLTAGAASTWDIGNNLLSLQTTNNGAVQTGTGLWTQGGNITFNGTTARTITGPSTGGLTITVDSGPLALTTTTSGGLSLNSVGALSLTGAAASTWSTGSAALTLQSGNFNVASGGRVTLAGGQAPDISTAVTSGVAAALTLQPGTATGANNGATVTLQGGTAGGTGVKGLIQLNGSTYFTTGSYSSGTTATITQSLVDSNSAITATATAASLVFTVPSPTITTAGRVLYITNVGGTNAFTLAGAGTSFTLNTGSTATLMWSGSAWTSAGVDASTLQNVYNNSTGNTTPEILLDTTRRGIDIQDANTTLGSTEALLAVRASATASTLGTGLFVVNASGKVGINTGSTSTTPTISYDVSLGQIAGATTARTIGVEAQGTTNIGGNGLSLTAGTGNGTAAGGQLTLQGGGTGTGAAAVGGAVLIQGGTSSGASGASNGGTVTLQGGTAGTGGTKGLIQLNGATYFTTGSYSSGSTSSITQSLIDSNSAILATATATSLTFTVPSPTVTTASGRIIYISNVGTNPFTLAGAGTSFTLNAGSTATLLWNGSAWTSAGVDASTLQNVYNNSAASPTPEILLDSTRHGLDIQDANTTLGSTEALLAVRASATATSLGNGLFVVNASGKVGINLSSTSTTPTISNDLSFGAGANRTIGVEAQSASNTAGNNITLAGGTANGTGAGGNTVLQGGAASATAGSNGGGITLTAAAGSVTGTGGAGGAVTIQGGSAGGSGNNNGGGVTVGLGAATGTGTQGTFQVQNAVGASLLTVDPSNTAASLNLISNGGAESGSPPTGFAAQGSGSSVATGTGTDAASGSQSAKVTFGTTANAGTKISFATAPTASTTVNYIVSFSAKQVSGTAVAPGNTALQVLYSPDNGTTLTATCSNYSSSASLSTTAWTKVSCTFIPGSTTVTTALLIIRQADTPGVSRVIDIDNVSVVQQNSSGATNVGDLKVGGAVSQGLTLFTLDTYSATPFSGSNASLAGSMYFDTSQGKIQCYDGSNWGACGAAPNTIVTLTPEYAGAVLDSAGVSTNIGTMTSDFCANSAALTVGTLCSSGDARNFYKWTSPQGSLQSYSIFVTYKLPATFKSFVASSTSLTGLVDNTTNASVKYAIFKSTGSAVTSCSATATVVGAGTGSANTWTTGVAGTLSGSTDPSTCGFVAGNNIIFQITVQADNNASSYPENLNFQYSNQ
ncbi:MAG TPA: hypothetical protein VLF71_02880 [Candidatus Saccharimonadales bacterium]|nr:hypothetical protein [Candidatus Saccharimonadales bacterium]